MAMLNDEEMDFVYKSVCSKMAAGLREAIDESSSRDAYTHRGHDETIVDLRAVIAARDDRIEKLEAKHQYTYDYWATTGNWHDGSLCGIEHGSDGLTDTQKLLAVVEDRDERIKELEALISDILTRG